MTVQHPVGDRPAASADRPGDRRSTGHWRPPGTAIDRHRRPTGYRQSAGDRPDRRSPWHRRSTGHGNRPGGGNRPIIGGGNNIVNRPGGNNNFVNINNRPGWGLGDGGHGNWADHWYNHHVPPHYHGWYHGCWSGNWGHYWYAPVVAGATAWGLNALLPSWGYAYGYTYANPYYVASAAPVYDYSQPIVVNTYNTPAADASAESTPIRRR